MKKIVKNVILMMLLATVCVAFAGCGNKKNSNSGNDGKMVVSKQSDSDNYNQKIEILFDGEGKANKFVMTIECYDVDVANSMVDLLKMSDKLSNSDIVIDGTKVKVELSPKDFFDEEGLEYSDERLGRDSIKKMFEANGYMIVEE